MQELTMSPWPLLFGGVNKPSNIMSRKGESEGANVSNEWGRGEWL